MPLSINEYTYPFDPTGTAPSNKVTGEPHVITQVNWRDYYFVIPKFAPFFGDSVELYFTDPQGNIVPLDEGKDYYLGHHFLAASRACGKQVYGSISFINRQFIGVMSVTYQTVGGKWTYDLDYLTQVMTNITSNPRISTWDSIVELPALFPVIDHEWDLTDMVGQSEVVLAIQSLADVIADPAAGNQSGVAAALAAHIDNTSNPHRTNKGQVGLGNVPNYPVADMIMAAAGTDDASFLTPAGAMALILAKLGQGVKEHVAEQNGNPHGTTAEDVGTLTTAEIMQLLLGKLNANAAAADATKAFGKTLAELTTSILAGKAATAEDSNKLGGKTLAEVMEAILGGNIGNAEKLGGQTLEDIQNYVLAATVLNATKFSGMTTQELYSAIPTQAMVARQKQYASQLQTLAGSGDLWTKLFSLPGSFGTAVIAEDAQVLVTGGQGSTFTNSTLFHLQVSAEDNALIVRNMSNLPVDSIFEVESVPVMVDPGGGAPLVQTGVNLNVWMKTPIKRVEITVTELSRGRITFPNLGEHVVGGLSVPDNVVIVQPTNTTAQVDFNTVANSDRLEGQTLTQIMLAAKQQTVDTATNAAKLGNQLPAYYATAAVTTNHEERIAALETQLAQLMDGLNTSFTAAGT